VANLVGSIPGAVVALFTQINTFIDGAYPPTEADCAAGEWWIRTTVFALGWLVHLFSVHWPLCYPHRKIAECFHRCGCWCLLCSSICCCTFFVKYYKTFLAFVLHSACVMSWMLSASIPLQECWFGHDESNLVLPRVVLRVAIVVILVVYGFSKKELKYTVRFDDGVGAATPNTRRICCCLNVIDETGHALETTPLVGATEAASPVVRDCCCLQTCCFACCPGKEHQSTENINEDSNVRSVRANPQDIMETIDIEMALARRDLLELEKIRTRFEKMTSQEEEEKVIHNSQADNVNTASNTLGSASSLGATLMCDEAPISAPSAAAPPASGSAPASAACGSNSSSSCAASSSISSTVIGPVLGFASVPSPSPAVGENSSPQTCVTSGSVSRVTSSPAPSSTSRSAAVSTDRSTSSAKDKSNRHSINRTRRQPPL
jgi:hypothetical protein